MNIRRQIAYLIKKNCDREIKNVNKELRNLTFAQMNSLIYLNDKENFSASQSEVANYLGVTRPTMVGVVNVMEKRGLVTCSLSPINKKTKIIRSTQLSREMLDSYILDCEEAFYDKMFADIPQDELEGLHKTLAKINMNLEKE